MAHPPGAGLQNPRKPPERDLASRDKLTNRLDTGNVILSNDCFVILFRIERDEPLPPGRVRDCLSEGGDGLGTVFRPGQEGGLGWMRYTEEGYRVAPNQPSGRFFVV